MTRVTRYIALVGDLPELTYAELARVGAALRKQVARDLSGAWDIAATVEPFRRLEDVPVGYWPILVTGRDQSHDSGQEIDRNGAPLARVLLSPSWSLAASRACLQMLTNPLGKRTVTALSPRHDQWQVEFCVHICDPCRDARYAYSVDGVMVSDFCRPSFFEQDAVAGDRFSFTGAVQAPFEVLPGGQLSWIEPLRDTWWMRSYVDDRLTDTLLGKNDQNLDVLGEHHSHSRMARSGLRVALPPPPRRPPGHAPASLMPRAPALSPPFVPTAFADSETSSPPWLLAPTAPTSMAKRTPTAPRRALGVAAVAALTLLAGGEIGRSWISRVSVAAKSAPISASTTAPAIAIVTPLVSAPPAPRAEGSSAFVATVPSDREQEPLPADSAATLRTKNPRVRSATRAEPARSTASEPAIELNPETLDELIGQRK